MWILIRTSCKDEEKKLQFIIWEEVMIKLTDICTQKFGTCDKHDQFLLLRNPRLERKSCELCNNSFTFSTLCKACAEMKWKLFIFNTTPPSFFSFLIVFSIYLLIQLIKFLMWTKSCELVESSYIFFLFLFFCFVVSVVRSLRFRAWTIRQVWRWESLHRNNLKSQWKGLHKRITLKCRNFKIF